MVAAAVVSGVAAVGGAAISANASSKASKAATNAATQNNALERDIYNQNVALETPWRDMGLEAGKSRNALLGLGGDQGAADGAFQKYLDSTGYKFRLGEGMNAITSNRAASGMLNSGSTLKALNEYGQNLASGEFGNYMGYLGDQQGVGLSATNALAGIGTNYSSSVGANNNSAASAVGNAALSNASNVNSLLGSLAGAYGTYRGMSALGGGNALGALSSGGMSSSYQNNGLGGALANYAYPYGRG